MTASRSETLQGLDLDLALARVQFSASLFEQIAENAGCLQMLAVLAIEQEDGGDLVVGIRTIAEVLGRLADMGAEQCGGLQHSDEETWLLPPVTSERLAQVGAARREALNVANQAAK